MYKHWYHTDWKKTTKQRVRQIVTIGLPAEINPEDVTEFGFIPFIDDPQPAHTNIEKVVDAGIVVTGTEATQTWSVVDRFDTPEEAQAYLDRLAEDLAAQIVANEITDLKTDLKSALVWQFRMIEALWETGVTKGIWGASDITNVELKQKYVEWKTKLSRLAELGE